jgi:hypothetical protein
MPGPSDAKLTQYDMPLQEGLYIKNYLLSRDDGSLEFFAVSLLCVIDGKPREIARYDNEGGTVHRDRLHPNGGYLEHRGSVRLGTDLHDAIKAARTDLAKRCEWYREAFLACL